ncbi:hypothetical protein HDU96_003029 [Phlyctochytrium bullatum]|nr:hypothetical protein HDU96_003029 [Phlyctochytrium bullatum]
MHRTDHTASTSTSTSSASDAHSSSSYAPTPATTTPPATGHPPSAPGPYTTSTMALHQPLLLNPHPSHFPLQMQSSHDFSFGSLLGIPASNDASTDQAIAVTLDQALAAMSSHIVVPPHFLVAEAATAAGFPASDVLATHPSPFFNPTPTTFMPHHHRPSPPPTRSASTAAAAGGVYLPATFRRARRGSSASASSAPARIGSQSPSMAFGPMRHWNPNPAATSSPFIDAAAMSTLGFPPTHSLPASPSWPLLHHDPASSFRPVPPPPPAAASSFPAASPPKQRLPRRRTATPPGEDRHAATSSGVEGVSNAVLAALESIGINMDAETLARTELVVVGTDGVKRVVCPLPGCGKSFSTTGHLSRHIKGHSGLKPYKCPIDGCECRFARHDNMLQHKRAHLRRLERMASKAPTATALPQTGDAGLLAMMGAAPAAAGAAGQPQQAGREE